MRYIYFCFLIIFVTWKVRQWNPTPVLLPGKSHGWKSLVGCSPWDREESGTTERLHFPFSLSCIGEGNGTPLQCSCLENPRDGGAWWAAVYGVTQSRTWPKRLSSSSSKLHNPKKRKRKSWSKIQQSENKDHGIWSHHFMANTWRNNGNMTDFISLGSKITTDGDCSHEIKRHLLLGRKAKTN